MADDVIRLMDYLRLPRAAIVGQSMGAVVVANVALRYPKRVAAVAMTYAGGQ